MARELSGLLLLNVLVLLGGCGVLVAAGWSELRSVFRWASVAYVAGAAYAGVAGSLLLVAGLSWNKSQFTGTVALPWLVYLIRRAVGPRERQSRSTEPAAGGWVKVAGLLIAGTTVVRSIWQPLSGWDAWSFWTPKSESIVHFHALSAHFLQSGVANPDYPLLVPSLESLAFRFMGSFDTTLVHLQFSLLLLGFVAGVAELVCRRERAERSAAVVILIAAAPSVVLQTLDAYADIPVAIFCSLGALALWCAIEEERPGASALSVLFLAAAFATKIEGVMFVAAMLAILLILSRGRRRSQRRLIGIAGAAAGLSVVPWQIWLATNDISAGGRFIPAYIVHRPERAWHALETLAVDFFDPRQWLLLPVVVVIGIVYGLRSREARGAALFAGATLVLGILALDVIYWGTSYPFQWQLDTSAARVVTTPLLFGATFAAWVFATAGMEEAEAGRLARPVARRRRVAVFRGLRAPLAPTSETARTART